MRIEKIKLRRCHVDSTLDSSGVCKLRWYLIAVGFFFHKSTRKRKKYECEILVTVVPLVDDPRTPRDPRDSLLDPRDPLFDPRDPLFDPRDPRDPRF